jgi:Lar family restriction alleviation protein
MRNEMNQVSDEPTLAACPFCGGDELSHGHSFPPHQGEVQCHTCDAQIFAGSEAEAIAAWNRRAPSPIEQPEHSGDERDGVPESMQVNGDVHTKAAKTEHVDGVPGTVEASDGGVTDAG